MAFILAGCATQKRCFEKWPPEIKVDTVERTVVQYVDTTVYVQMPGDTVEVNVPVYIVDTVEGKPIVITYEEARAETEYAEARAWVEKSVLELELIQKDSLIEIRLDSVIAIKDHYVELYTTEIHESPPEMKCPLRSIIFYIAIGFAGGVLLMLIGLIVLKK